MGLPNINIIFKSKGSTVVKRGERGIVALILKDGFTPLNNPLSITDVKDIPQELSQDNKKQIELAFMGGIKSPKRVIAYIIPNEAVDYSEAQSYLETVKWDYVAIPSIKEGEVSAMATWIKGLRDNKDIKVKGVLPNCSADHEGIINFATDDIKTKEKVYKASEYCSRIAGILAGNPLTMSATYQVLPEVIDVPHLTKEEFDSSINSGKLLLMHDGEKVKIARAINSLVTVTSGKGEDFKKILIVDKCDMWHEDIKSTVEDNYLGKYANNYDNKILLITAIQAYNDSLIQEGLLDNSSPNYNRVFVDIDSQINFLKSLGIEVENMSEQEIKEANTKDKVFLGSNLKWTDAMEDFTINIGM